MPITSLEMVLLKDALYTVKKLSKHGAEKIRNTKREDTANTKTANSSKNLHQTL